VDVASIVSTFGIRLGATPNSIANHRLQPLKVPRIRLIDFRHAFHYQLTGSSTKKKPTSIPTPTSANAVLSLFCHIIV
jgi:hypothetical protein